MRWAPARLGRPRNRVTGAMRRRRRTGMGNTGHRMFVTGATLNASRTESGGAVQLRLAFELAIDRIVVPPPGVRDANYLGIDDEDDPVLTLINPHITGASR
jgi:hypothetical protein